MTINNRRQNDNSNNGKEEDYYEAAATQRHINDSDSDNAEEKRAENASTLSRQAARQDRKTNSLTHINRLEISQRRGAGQRRRSVECGNVQWKTLNENHTHFISTCDGSENASGNRNASQSFCHSATSTAKYPQFPAAPNSVAVAQPDTLLSPLAASPSLPLPPPTIPALHSRRAATTLDIAPMQQRQNKKLFGQMGKLQGILSEIP